jgi:hypothetical protein
MNVEIHDVVKLESGDIAKVVSNERGWIGLNTGKKVRIKQIVDVVGEADLEEGEEEKSYNMASHLNQYRAAYETVKSATGNKSKVCGDDLSHLLAMMLPDDVIALATYVLDRDDLFARYGSLNEGQKRMNAGNLLRNAIKREEITVDDIREGAKAISKELVEE